LELKQAIGARRSIRYYQSWRPVELSKIQKMLEAARLASHAGNMGLLRAVVIDNTDPSPEVLEAVTGPGSQVHGSQAPILILWYVDVAHRGDWAARLKELIDAGALNTTHGWSYTFAERIAGSILEGMDKRFAGAITPGEAMDAGQGIAQATLVAFEEGLGTCCNGFDGAKFKAALGLPDSAIPICLQTVGYPAESREAGGQRPRRPFEEIFHLGRYGSPFPRDPAVVEELTHNGMIQAPAPLPWLKQEVRALARLFGLPE
jgi:nitroreductase